MSNSPTDEAPGGSTGFDLDALREKYRQERDKRLHPEGNRQYVEAAGRFAHYVEDPYVDPGFRRPPLHDDVEVVVIGGGFGGLLAAARLRESGVEDLRIIEKGGDFGGTWYWNRYPGAQCDVESYIYLPLLEEIGYVPREKYSHAPEILAHSRAIGRAYDLYRNACLQTEVTELRWDEESSRWIVRTNRDDRMRARFVVMANGPLNRPKLPGIPGIETFEGHSFHTSRWDYGYTGGDSNGGLVGLRDKGVGIIGTGATSVQCVPHLGAWAKQLFVFQRTPSSIDVRGNRPTDPEWASGLEPGWQRRRMDNFNILVSGGLQKEDLVGDGWTDIIRKLLVILRSESETERSPRQLLQKAEIADFVKMEEIRARVEALVQDPDTAEALKPWYRQFCKRPCFHDEYLATFNRSNVTLVDTAGRGVSRITPKGVVVGEHEYALDCLIFATGFEVGTSYTRRAGYELFGRDGVKLSDYWADGMRTLHGIHTRGFPNCFTVGAQQGGFTVNFPHMLNEVSRHIAYVIREARERGCRTLEVSQEAEDTWVQTIIGKSGRARAFFEDCTPGYYNNEGQPAERNGQDGFYGGGSMEYFRILEAWRTSGTLEGMELE